MISYWKLPKEVYIDDGMVLIIGKYDHKNSNNGGEKALGLHWGDYPQSRGILSPCVVPEVTRNAILSGLLTQSIAQNDMKKIEGITEAIKYFNEK